MLTVTLRSLIVALAALLLLPAAGAQIMFPTDNTDKTDENAINKRRLLPMVYYSNPDRVFAGLRFRISPAHLDQPHRYEQAIQLRYSISQNAFSAVYTGNFKELIGPWNLSFNAYYDWLVWTNFFGLGNDTRRINSIQYYRLSTSQYAGNVSLNRVINDKHYLDLETGIIGVEVLNKPNTIVSTDYLHDKTYYFEHHIYAGINASYAYQDVDDYVLPQKGVFFYAGGGYNLNAYQSSKSFGKYNGIAQCYVPLFNKVSLSVRAGGAAISGTPEFYQYVSVGGPMSIRGYYRDRFWGNEAFYNSNELRFITNLRVKSYNNKIGFLVLFDDGRVWLNGENSSTLHYGYGAGILVAPLHKFTAYATYSRSPEGGLLQFKVSTLLSKIPVANYAQMRY